MLVSAVPGLIDALFTQATAALSSVTVIDGPGTDFGSEGDYLLVGVDDPDRQDAQFSAQVDEEWAFAGPRVRDQRGALTCAAYSWTGNTDPTAQKAMRDDVYATVGGVQNLIAADPSLGLSYLSWSGKTAETLSQNQDAGGTSALLIFQISYRSRLT